jgi:flagellar hook-basal body complex protein FliE
MTVAAISTVSPPVTGLTQPAAASVTRAPGASFTDMLETGIERLNAQMLTADSLVTRLAAGEDVDLHEVMIALETESIGVQTALQIRNKAIEAYKEIMAMPI